MRLRHFDEHSLDDAWQHVLREIEQAGIAEPQPGFTARWQTRLAAQRKAEQRRQAWIILGINIIVILSILSLLVGFSCPIWSNPSEMFVSWVGGLSRLVISINMVGGVIASLVRTLPGLIPFSWWVVIAVSSVIVFLVWFVTFRQYALRQGVTHEDH